MHLLFKTCCCFSLLLLSFLPFCKTTQKVGQSQGYNENECRSGKITVWGESPIFSSETVARDKAKEDACRRAVEKCIGQEVASATGVSEGQSILNEIFTKTRGICKNDRLLKEEKYDIDTTKMLRAFYRFTVKPSELTDKINLMQQLMGNPKVMVLIREVYKLPQEKVEGFHSRNALSAKLLREFLTSQGYSVIDTATVQSHLKNEKALLANPEKANDFLKDAAMKSGADVLIIGQVTAKSQKMASLSGTGLQSFRAVGNITLLSLWGFGRVLGEYTDSKTGAQVTPLAAARKAIQQMMTGGKTRRSRKNVTGMLAYVDKRLKAQWAEATRNNKIKMNITGLSLSISGIFRDNLIQGTAVKSINEIEKSQKKIRWELSYPGRAFSLADTISFYKENPKIFPILKRANCGPIDVKRVKRGEITIHFTNLCK